MRFSVMASALVAAVVGFGSTLAIVIEAAKHLGATQDQASSWISMLCLGMAITSAFLSIRFKMPIVTAWSLAGLVLIVATPSGTAMGDAIGAFMFSGALTVLAGAVPAVGAAIGRLPASVAGGMLAGLILRFALGLFTAAQTDPGLVLPLLAVFLAARLLHPASAPLIVIAAAAPIALLEGYPMHLPPPSLSTVAWMPPSFSPAVLLSLGVPMFLVTMATQQISGAAVLRVSGYTPPMSAVLVTTGLATVALAPFGAYSINLSSLTAAICTGSDAHPNPAKRWQTGPCYAVVYLLFALVGASLVTAVSALPPVLVATVVGTALLAPLTAALTASVAHEQERFPAILAFVVTASGMTLIGIGSAFWGLLAGVLAVGVERLKRR